MIGDQVNVRESRIGDIRQRQKRMAGSEKRREIEGGKRLEKFTMHFFPCKITRFTESAKVSNILEELERVTLEHEYKYTIYCTFFSSSFRSFGRLSDRKSFKALLLTSDTSLLHV